MKEAEIYYMYDFSMIYCIEQLKETNNQFGQLEDMHSSLIKHYMKSNYWMKDDNANQIKKMIQVKAFNQRDIFLKRKKYIVLLLAVPT